MVKCYESFTPKILSSRIKSQEVAMIITIENIVLYSLSTTLLDHTVFLADVAIPYQH